MTVPRQQASDIRRSSGFGRHTGPILWVLHGWLAMFCLGAAFAKLSEPIEMLTLLMDWPRLTSLEVVRAVGWIELTLVVLVLAPLLSDGGLARRLALGASAVVTANAVAMLVFYLVRPDFGLAATNAALILLGAGILIGHRSAPLR